MITLYMTIGLPASGKTTWARSKMAEHPGSYKRINKDDLRAMLDDGRWSPDNEKFVLAMSRSLIDGALGHGKHVICDDTNLHPKHEAALRKLAKKRNAAFEVVDFRGVSLEECIERDRKRANYVGEKVIRKMWNNYLAPKVESVVQDASLPECAIVDIDGTLAIMNGRDPFDWGRVGEDGVNFPVWHLVNQIKSNIHVIFMSGRDEVCRAETESWLIKHLGVLIGPLYMRPASDTRDDRIIKRELYEREVKGKYNVLFVLDDRDKVVRQWREMGLACFQVAEGDF